tara:strand:+ start:49977 stop:50144 length:168 start_codon:yes stop_codon:yes gene_type:complete
MWSVFISTEILMVIVIIGLVILAMGYEIRCAIKRKKIEKEGKEKHRPETRCNKSR